MTPLNRRQTETVAGICTSVFPSIRVITVVDLLVGDDVGVFVGEDTF